MDRAGATVTGPPRNQINSVTIWDHPPPPLPPPPHNAKLRRDFIAPLQPSSPQSFGRVPRNLFVRGPPYLRLVVSYTNIIFTTLSPRYYPPLTLAISTPPSPSPSPSPAPPSFPPHSPTNTVSSPSPCPFATSSFPPKSSARSNTSTPFPHTPTPPPSSSLSPREILALSLPSSTPSAPFSLLSRLLLRGARKKHIPSTIRNKLTPAIRSLPKNPEQLLGSPDFGGARPREEDFVLTWRCWDGGGEALNPPPPPPPWQEIARSGDIVADEMKNTDASKV
ncbi:unnamed protein product [Zymoseptoria tritici ST99CH_1E4]|uniref:Uncharacterized protein n=1 Tax=Zymoseptoria tritici ST99CH_1E4 TaxID=1276532 RepID=A0A2H1H9R1_ZYMTR|nr:unnamed protein product [Zymoseptoria tritici ST99CH_1E4]